MEMETQAAAPDKLVDYELEQYWQCPCCFERNRANGHTGGPSWQQLVQFAVNHAIHDYYMLPSEGRTAIAILDSLEKRWTNKVKAFASMEHFERVKKAVSHYLVIHLLRDVEGKEPFCLFEHHAVHLPEVGTELSMIFQVAEWGESSLVIKKFIVQANPNIVRAFLHMTVAFANRAFGKLPERIEVHALLDGATYTAFPVEQDISASLDYLHLMRGVLKEDAEAAGIRH